MKQLGSTGEFLITLMSSFAEEESRSISENVTWAVRHRYAQGIYHLPGLLLGYQRSPVGEIQVDEAGARVVRFIYLLALTGKSSTDICRILMDYGIPSPGHSQRWEPHTVRSILKNEKYMGDAILQKEITMDFLTKTRKPNEGEAPQYYVENGHPGIVSKSVWQEVQAIWTDANRRNCTFSPIANKIICGDCGGRYGRKTWHSTTYRDAVWECISKKAGCTKCKCRHIYAEELDTAIRRSMNHLLKTHTKVAILLASTFPPIPLPLEEKAKTNDKYVFPSPNGGPISPDSVNNMLKRVLERAGIPKVRFHDLRHTFATLALQNGVDIKTVSGMLGHFSAGFTLDTYTHVTTYAQKEAAQTMGNVLSA